LYLNFKANTFSPQDQVIEFSSQLTLGLENRKKFDYEQSRN